MPDEEKRTHDRFNASDSDVTIESADGVLFCLHTQNLKINTGAFPGSEFTTEGEPTKLTEDAEVLEVVFAAVYPQRHPNLEDMEFALLSKIAEAVEKYEVFPAMNICAVRMKEFLPEHAEDVLVHGVKHGYTKLINEAALALSRSPLMSKFIFKFSPTTVLAWIRYSESWKDIFKSAIACIESMAASGYEYCTLRDGYANTSSLCHKCRLALFKWVMKLEEITSILKLKDALSPLAHRDIPNLVYCGDWNGHCSSGFLRKCMHLEVIAKVITDGVANIPPFEQFFNQAIISQ